MCHDEFFVEDILEEIFSLTPEEEQEICSEALHDSPNKNQKKAFKVLTIDSLLVPLLTLLFASTESQ